MRINVRHTGDDDDWRDMLNKQFEDTLERALCAACGPACLRVLESERIQAANRGANDPLIKAEAQARGVTVGSLIQEINQANQVRAQTVGVIAGLSVSIKTAIRDGDFTRAKELIRALENSV